MDALHSKLFVETATPATAPKGVVWRKEIYEKLAKLVKTMNENRSQFKMSSTIQFVSKVVENSTEFNEVKDVKQLCESAYHGEAASEKRYHEARQIFMSCLLQLAEEFFPENKYKETLDRNIQQRIELLQLAETVCPDPLKVIYVEPMKQAFQITNIPFSETYLTGIEALIYTFPKIEISGSSEELSAALNNAKKMHESFLMMTYMASQTISDQNEGEFKKHLKDFSDTYLVFDTREVLKWKQQLLIGMLEIQNSLLREQNQLLESRNSTPAAPPDRNN